ncbi:hypothetical protein [uncultured Eubacterium sp.]|uniref:hypothetical protein n=1 Tax=uncultured Eubacterium sp. TaxID=165185 RepID=UPI0025946161|nr:hypothetical protein [uncultured Eubacterium sp.]
MSTMIDKLNDILDEKHSKIIPENIKAGVTAFGVNGSLKAGGDVKLFKSIEAMNADTNKQKDDLAIVYTDTITHLTSSDVGKQIDHLILPDIITLSKQFTGNNKDIILRNEDAGLFLDIQMATSMLMFDGHSNGGQFMGNYMTQSDGVTLKKERFDIMTTDVTLENDVLKFSQPMTIESIEDVLVGEACILSRHTFGGLYQANPVVNKDDIDVLRSFSGYSDISTVRENIHVGADKITEVRNALIAAGVQKNGIFIFNGDTADYIYYKGDYDGFWAAMVNGELCIVCSINYESSCDAKTVMPMIKATYDFTTKQITNTEFETVPTIDQLNLTKQVAFNATNRTWMLLSTKSDIIGSYDNGDIYYMNLLHIWVGDDASNETYVGYSHNKYEYGLAEQ